MANRPTMKGFISEVTSVKDPPGSGGGGSGFSLGPMKKHAIKGIPKKSPLFRKLRDS